MSYVIKDKDGKAWNIELGSTATSELYPDSSLELIQVMATKVSVDKNEFEHTFINNKSLRLVVNNNGEYKTMYGKWLPARLTFKLE